MTPWLSVLVVVALGWSAGAAQAQTVYRCGNQYSQVPCPEGRVVEATDPRTAAQRAAAKRVAEQERRQAAEMERERLAKEAAAAPASAASLSAKPAEPAASVPKHGRPAVKRKKPRRSDDFAAVVPRPANRAP
jgi:hypothetical protein